MSTTNFEAAQLLWQARDEMVRAADEMRAAQSIMIGLEPDIGWMSPASRRAGARVADLIDAAGTAAVECGLRADAYLDLGNRMALR